MKAGRLGGLEWDAIAGIVAAVVAVVLHTLHVVENDVLLAVVVTVLALLLLRDLRRESREARLLELVRGMKSSLARYEAALTLPEAQLVGPGSLRAESERFAREAGGQVTYFNVCLLMFRPQALFDNLLRPAVENPRVSSILFVLDRGERDHWEQHVAPKIAQCTGSAKVLEPCWCDSQGDRFVHRGRRRGEREGRGAGQLLGRALHVERDRTPGSPVHLSRARSLGPGQPARRFSSASTASCPGDTDASGERLSPRIRFAEWAAERPVTSARAARLEMGRWLGARISPSSRNAPATPWLRFAGSPPVSVRCP